ncbi:CheC-like family protein [uncultured archaeon]|nr:CheC-like family protein [uncultured archaeon]
MNELKTLTEFQADALKEVGNIGIGQATTSLSMMVNRTIKISMPDLKFIPLVKVPDLVKFQEPQVGIILELKGDYKGFILYLLSKDSAKFLTNLVLGASESQDTFSEMEQSVLNELGNIMGGAYITALSNFLGISISLSCPFQLYDMAEAIINQVIGIMSLDVDNVLFLETEFDIKNEKLAGKMFIFTDAQSLSGLLDAINRIAEI